MAPNYIYVSDGSGPNGTDTIGFVSLSGLSIVFYGESHVLDSAAPPAVFSGWTYAAWEINPPAEPFSGGQTSAYSATIVGPSPTVDGERRVLLTANEGVDSTTCGDPSNKCRSIGQAIRNARSGDTVLVEVGVYGDLNGNGILGDLGEEADRTGCGCVIHVDKAIAVLSERGAAATVIDARGVHASAMMQRTGVLLGTSDASFGYAGQGFTILTGPTRTGVVVRADALRTRIWGNRISGGVVGISGAEIEVYDSEITANGTGIVMATGRVSRSVVALNQGDGIRMLGSGFDLEGEATFADNVISGNGGVGLDLVSGRTFVTSVTGNDIVRNVGPGIRLEFDRNFRPSAVIQDNNIIGNGQSCGISNETSAFVWAADNYWGGLGVADRACNAPNAITVVDPARTEPDSRSAP